MASFYPAQFKNRTLRKCAHLCALVMGAVLIGFNQEEYGTRWCSYVLNSAQCKTCLKWNKKKLSFPRGDISWCCELLLGQFAWSPWWPLASTCRGHTYANVNIPLPPHTQEILSLWLNWEREKSSDRHCQKERGKSVVLIFQVSPLEQLMIADILYEWS